MNSWKSFQTSVNQLGSTVASTVQAGVANVDLNGTQSKINRGFSNLAQSVKEKTGSNVDITELPQEYLDLERRVDALKAAHVSMLKVAKAYENESYDYPTQLQESVSEMGGSLAHNLSFWAAAATKGTNLPQPTVAEKPAVGHKTLPHALSRAAGGAAVEVGGVGRLGDVLKTYAIAMDAVGEARIHQDDAISSKFLQPWSATLNSSLQAAIKSRAIVKSSRVALDACRGTLKTISLGGNAIKLEQGRLDVENAEEKLVNATEEAINLMRSVLENPEPIKNIIALLQAQKAFYHEAASALGNVEAQMEEMGVAAEAEYRKSRAQ